jgi:hypothetical protein
MKKKEEKQVEKKEKKKKKLNATSIYSQSQVWINEE